MTDELKHYGTPRESGRYPWGSGKNPYQRNQNFLAYVDGLKKEGMTESEIAKGIGITSKQLRAKRSMAINEIKAADQSRAVKLRDKGMSPTAIGRVMNRNESSIRAMLDPVKQARTSRLNTTAEMLKKQVDKKRTLDVGRGTELYVGVSETMMQNAVALLVEQGYKLHTPKTLQMGTGEMTKRKILSAPDVEFKEVVNNQDKIGTIDEFSPDAGATFFGLRPPTNLDSSRVSVRYGSEGGKDKDGVIELRRGVEDISLGNSAYAQVRIAVDGSHYLKGMAMYSDDLPKGVDVLFNTNKESTGNKLDAMKPMNKRDDDPTVVDLENPFGAWIKPGGQRGVLNIVNEEGDWDKWSKNLSSQALSKQSPALAKELLNQRYEAMVDEYETIKKLTNPSVKQILLESFSDGADAAAVHLKAAALPRQRTHAILPLNSIKETEVYAPNYDNGERVVLIRYPHGGKFEIPELVVNNKSKEARAILGSAKDAIGINAKVAERLSGADFDGDTVLVIPNTRNGRSIISTAPALEALKYFNPREEYKAYEGMPEIESIQTQMGNVSNLITDMTIRGAPDAELARAVRHSMVVIDAAKHQLNYKQSAKDHGIAELKKKYQGNNENAKAGASTIISRASSDIRVPDFKPRLAENGGPIDRLTGRRMYEPTNKSYVTKDGEVKLNTRKVQRLAVEDDAFNLSSGEIMESVYAEHSNKMKALANEARLEALGINTIKYSPSARETYANEVASLGAKLNLALRNSPRERHAQALAQAKVKVARQANPHMDNDEIRKVKRIALATARTRTGANKPSITFTLPEWDAIQAGAISKSKLDLILKNANLDQVKELATPRESSVMTASLIARATAMLNSGATRAEVARALGVSVSTLAGALE